MGQQCGEGQCGSAVWRGAVWVWALPLTLVLDGFICTLLDQKNVCPSEYVDPRRPVFMEAQGGGEPGYCVPPTVVALGISG